MNGTREIGVDMICSGNLQEAVKMDGTTSVDITGKNHSG